MRPGHKPAATREPPHDPALPALPVIFPPDGAPEFIAQFASEATGQRVRLEDGKLAYVRYRPTRNAVALWSFPTADGAHALISATAFRDDRGARITARQSFAELARLANAEASSDVPPYRYFEDTRVLLQLFPLDVRLPGLAPARSGAWLSESLLPALGHEASGRVHAEVIDYKPRHRCVIRYDVTSNAGPARYFAKLFRDGRGERFLPWLRAVSSRLDADGSSWTIAHPAAYLPNAWMLLLEAVEDAVELKDVIKRARDDIDARATVTRAFERAAAGLASLQRIEVDALPAITPHALLRRFEASMEGMAEVDPEAARLVTRCLHTLEEEASRLPDEPMVTTHGAYRHDQILIRGDQQAVLDLDTLCRSGASADAGNFLSYLDVTALRRRHMRPVIEAGAPAFEEAALRLPSVSSEWLAWYRSAGHVKKALRSYLSLDKKWPEMAEGLLGPLRRTPSLPRGRARA